MGHGAVGADLVRQAAERALGRQSRRTQRQGLAPQNGAGGLDLKIRACGALAARHPDTALRAALGQHRAGRDGVAVALDWGLIVPVIKNADNLSLVGLTRSLNDLANRARSKKLDPREVQDGTFTITNPGVFGSLVGTPIINQPQVGILCLGTIEKRPKVITGGDGEDTIAIRTCSYISLSFDHRIVDGADADRFMSLVKKGLETFPETVL